MEVRTVYPTFFVSLVILAILFPQKTSSQIDVQPPKTVVIIRYKIEPNNFASVVNGLKQSLKKRGYVEGKNITYIDVLTSTADQRSIPQVMEAVKKYSSHTDLFVTCGWVSMFARILLKDTGIPQLFCPTLKSVALKMVPSVNTPTGTNLTGVYLMYPPEKILRISRLILPNAKHYAYVFDSRIPADMVFKKAYEGLRSEERHDFEILFFDLANGIDSVIKKLQNKHIEAFGGIVGVFKNKKALSSLRIPIITALTLDIEETEIADYLKGANIIAGLFNPFSYCGQQAGEMAADIFDGKTTIENTVPRPALQIAFVNLRAAKRLGIYIPYRALEAVDMVVK